MHCARRRRCPSISKSKACRGGPSRRPTSCLMPPCGPACPTWPKAPTRKPMNRPRCGPWPRRRRPWRQRMVRRRGRRPRWQPTQSRDGRPLCLCWQRPSRPWCRRTQNDSPRARKNPVNCSISRGNSKKSVCSSRPAFLSCSSWSDPWRSGNSSAEARPPLCRVWSRSRPVNLFTATARRSTSRLSGSTSMR